MANVYNKRASKIFFSVNDWCYVKINVPTNKFGPRWKGPFKIVKKLSDILYLVKIDGKDKVTNISKFKPYKHSKYFPDISTENSLTNADKSTNTGPAPCEICDNEISEDRFVYRPITVNYEENMRTHGVTAVRTVILMMMMILTLNRNHKKPLQQARHKCQMKFQILQMILQYKQKIFMKIKIQVIGKIC